jgi:hypothetical protein
VGNRLCMALVILLAFIVTLIGVMLVAALLMHLL